MEARKVYSTDNLTGWIERKNQAAYYQMLEDIAENILSLFPEDATHNAHKVEKIYTFPLIYQRTYAKLVSSLTLLHHPYRCMEKGYYLSSQEDNLLAFRLMQPLTVPETLLRRKTRELYDELKTSFGYHPFTFREAQKIIQQPVSTQRRHFIALENSGYIQRVGGDRKNGYYYETLK